MGRELEYIALELAHTIDHLDILHYPSHMTAHRRPLWLVHTLCTRSHGGKLSTPMQGSLASADKFETPYNANIPKLLSLVQTPPPSLSLSLSLTHTHTHIHTARHVDSCMRYNASFSSLVTRLSGDLSYMYTKNVLAVTSAWGNARRLQNRVPNNVHTS